MASTVRDRQRGERRQVQSRQDRGRQQVKSSHIITEHIDVGVSTDVAFDCWTHYDKWSEVFKNESAKGGGGKRGGQQQVKVSAKIGPSERKWTAEVVDVEPGHRIRWRSKGPLKAEGTTTFHRLDDHLTRLMAEIEYQPTGLLEIVGNFFRMQRRRVRRDLRLYKNYVELRGPSGDEGEEESD